MDRTRKKIIVSLTSYPPAIGFVASTVRSLLEGSVLPDKIILYVTPEEFGETPLPADLLKLAEENEIFEIRAYPNNIRSYRKLYPALLEFPEDIIVTVDDDVRYHRHMLRDLLRLHNQYPGTVIAHRAKRMDLSKPYRKWHKYRWYDFLLQKDYSGFRNLQTGVGGVLYPPHSLDESMIDESLFTSLAPTTDDIWFWAAAVSRGTRIMPAPFGRNKPKGLGKPAAASLKTYNFKSGRDRNSEALRAILERFPAIKEKVEHSAR
ncbi:MAG: glycosyltransferase [Muribaculaceae bacterium]|nr:glycosyltransferase [Muribaculaceae bacterium]